MAYEPINPHPARVMPYRDLADGLRSAVERRLVSEKASGDLRLYCYAPNCVYDRAWDEVTLLARGLILDAKREAVVATPFPKFFNVGERDETIPDLPFDATEKLDGSLIILWCDGDAWRCATKGSFDSEQAQAAQAWLRDQPTERLAPGCTYLCEWVAPDNRIVVYYELPELVLLAVYGEAGNEWSYPLVQACAGTLGWRVAERHQFASVSDLLLHATDLPASAEGFVLRFADGLRLKVKGDEYRRIHALISRCTPLAMWEAMLAGDDMNAIRQQLPEEFWSDFDGITETLNSQVASAVAEVASTANVTSTLSDKDVGLALNTYSPVVRKLIFPYRKSNGNLLENQRSREALFRFLRPTGNRLEGYTPSYAMNRVMDEAL